MKKSRHQVLPGSISQITLLAVFMALTVLILLAALRASGSSLQGNDHKTIAGTSKGAGYITDHTYPKTIKPLGVRPAHLRTDPVKPVPNQQAITRALWAPGIDHGYVPQGLAFAEGQILVSAYRSTNPAVSMGPCRVYRMDPESGIITGYFDLPPACGHAGGLAYAGGGVLILSDTRRLYRINLEQALREKHARNAITGTLELAGALRGSFITIVPAAFVPAAAWPGNGAPDKAAILPGTGPGTGPGARAGTSPGMFIGAWSTAATKARGYFLPLGLFDSHNGTNITEDNASSSIPLAARAQGGSVAPDGSFWLSYSSHDFGRIEQVDPSSGQVLKSYPLVSGTEDISFDKEGGLWAVSEAGSLRWRTWRTSFPVVFRLDTRLLEWIY